MIRDEVGAMGGVQGIPPMPEIEISTGATVDDTEWHHFAICMEYVSGPWGKFDGVQYHVEEYYLTDVTIKLDNVTIASFTDVPTNPIMSLNPDFDPPENVDTPTIITEFGEWGRDPGAIGASDVVEAVTLAPINDTFEFLPGFYRFDGRVDDWLIIGEYDPDLVTDLFQFGAETAENYTGDNIIFRAIDADSFENIQAVIDTSGEAEEIADVLVDDALKAAAFFRVAIESLIGINTVFPANQISPLPTQGNVRPVEASTSITFNAPEFIYLDRFGNDLDPNDEDLIGKAYYRVRFADYSVDGVSQGIAGTREFTVTVEADMTVSWEWQVETALFVENAVDDFDLDTSFGSPGVLGLTSGGATTGAGKRFVTKEDFPQATINGFAFTGSSSEQKQRFRVRGYVIENDDSGSSRCLLLPGNNYLTHSGASGIDLTTATGSDYTIDFWARSEAEDDAADQVIFCMGNNTSSAAQIVMQTEQTAAGPRQLVLTDNDATVTLGEVNGDWNHWAIVMTPTTDELSIYRDGRLVRVHSFNSSFTFSGGDAITVGALNVGDGFSNFFEGAVENIRVWTRILTELEVRDSMRTGAYGDGYDGNLELELTFDSPSLTNIADDAGSVADFSYQNAAGLFQLSQSDPAILAALFPSFTFFFELCPEPVRTTPAYQITGNLSNVGELDLWQRVTFLWELQYKISLQVSETRFLGLPFIDTLEKCPEDTLAATWITAGEDIVVGTKFRSGDRRYTFMDIFAQTDIFEGITIDDLLDGTKDTVSTRDFAIDDLDEAGSLAFDFRRTIFRAVVPLGEGLHVADEDDKDIQLTPNLPDDALLNIIDGPGAPVNVITDNLDPASGITTAD